MKEKEYEISKLETHVYTDALTQVTSANCSDIPLRFPERGWGSGTEKANNELINYCEVCSLKFRMKVVLMGKSQ